MSKILRGTGILSTADFISRLFDVVRVVYITHFFSVAEFGLYTLATSTVLILGSFILPKFPTVILQFFPYYKEKGKKELSAFVSSSIGFILLNGLLFAGIMVASAHWVGAVYYQKPEVVPFVMMASLLIIISPLSNYLYQFLMADGRYITIFWSRIFSAILNLSLVFILSMAGYGIASLIAAYVMADLSMALIALFVLRKYLRILIPRLEKRVIQFWIPLVGTALFTIFTKNLPTIIIGRLLDTFSIGIYQITDRTVRMLYSALDPYMETTRAVLLGLAHKSKKSFVETMNKHNQYLAYVLAITGGASIAFAPIIFNLLYGNDYDAGIPYFIGLVVFMTVGYMNMMFPRVIYAVTNKNQIIFYATIFFTIVETTLMLTLISAFGLWGLISALAITRIMKQCVHLYFAKKLVPRFKIRSIITPLGLFLILYAIGFVVNLSLAAPSWIGLAGTVLFVALMHLSRQINIIEIIKEVWNLTLGKKLTPAG